jgi:acetylglutamate kinase
MVKDALKASFASDVNLLRSAGLFPVVVHGGVPEGGAPEDFEMILSGRVNTELVTLLNQGVAHAVGVSGKDAGLLRAKKPEPGQHTAKIISVQHELLEVLVGKEYVPVLSPVGLGEDGEGYMLDADDVAADVAVALKAEKLIFLTDVAGLLHQGELISEITAQEIEARRAELSIVGGMAIKVDAALRALRGGVSQVHIIDGRAAHGLVAELFTDRGIGTLVRA